MTILNTQGFIHASMLNKSLLFTGASVKLCDDGQSLHLRRLYKQEDLTWQYHLPHMRHGLKHFDAHNRCLLRFNNPQ